MGILIRYLQQPLLIFTLLILGACGMKSSPVSPDGSTYPAIYPQTPIESKKNNDRGLQSRDVLLEGDSEGLYQYPNRKPGN